MTVWERTVRAEALSLADAFDARRNSFNAIRLAMALAVIVSHAWPLSGRGHDPMIGDLKLGQWAVAGFFAISGYLITASRLSEPSTISFLRRRAMRIYPGYWAVLAFVAFIAAPIALLIADVPLSTWMTADDSGLEYLLRNATLIRGQITIAGAPFGVASTDWNGSLWSLPFEFACYVAMAVLGATATLRGSAWPTLAVTTALLVTNVLIQADVLPGAGNYYIDRFLLFGQFFFCGATLKVMDQHVPMHGDLAAAAAGILLLLAASGQTTILAGIPLAYLCLWLGIHLPLHELGRKTDISYGVYLYAFPIQQLLAIADVHEASFALYIVLSFALTLPLGYLSFIAIERPAQRLKFTRSGRSAVLTQADLQRREAPQPPRG